MATMSLNDDLKVIRSIVEGIDLANETMLKGRRMVNFKIEFNSQENASMIERYFNENGFNLKHTSNFRVWELSW